MHTAGRIRQVDVRIVLVVTPSVNVRISQICVRRYTAIDIITSQKRNSQLRLMSTEKELIQYINYRLMENERYYYAVATFQRKNGTISVNSVTSSVRGDEENIKFYPLMGIINKVEEHFGDEAVCGSVVIQSIVEISKQDYDAYNERFAKMRKVANEEGN